MKTIINKKVIIITAVVMGMTWGALRGSRMTDDKSVESSESLVTLDSIVTTSQQTSSPATKKLDEKQLVKQWEDAGREDIKKLYVELKEETAAYDKTHKQYQQAHAKYAHLVMIQKDVNDPKVQEALRLVDDLLADLIEHNKRINEATRKFDDTYRVYVHKKWNLSLN